MPSTTSALIIGAGQAGLAMSRSLTDAGVDHVVLERGRLAERWRSERWDSLRLLSPNWATRLPGWSYQGDDPTGFMTAAELVAHFETYAQSFDAPVREETTVRAVRYTEQGFAIDTDDGAWEADDVIIATGWCDQPFVPTAAAELSSDVTQLVPSDYRNPAQLPAGGVLVVGASATGVQIADELARAGRDVVLAVGDHNRVPRRYRGLDIWWWLERLGTFARTIDELPDPVKARSEGSIQLVGRQDGRSVDLPSLQADGVHLAGRLTGIHARQVQFADDLRATTARADGKLRRTLAQIDEHITASGLDAEVLDPESTRSVIVQDPIDRLDLRSAGIASVVWATGFARSYPWLHVPVLDATGEISHRRGVTRVPGLYVLGQRFQHRRDSNFIDGVRHDAAFVTDHLTSRQRCREQLAS